jgi:integrase
MYGDGRVYWRGEKPEGSKDGGSYWLYFNRHSKEVRMSARTNNKTRAKRMLRDELNKSRGDAWIDPKDRKVTIGELVADLEQHYRVDGREVFADDLKSRWNLHLKKTFEHVPAHALSTSLMRTYRAARIKAGAAQATINRELQCLRKAYRLAAESEPPKVSRVPKFLILREDNARQRSFTAEELERLLKAASREGLWARVLLELAYILGWRRGELLKLRVRDVNIAEQSVKIETSKNGDPRETALTPALATMLQQLVSGRDPNDLIFPKNRKHLPDVSAVRRAWERIVKAAKVEDATFHDFRRTSARAKRSAGVDGSIIMAMSGWKSPSMLIRYGIVDLANQREALSRLAKAAQQSHNSKDHDS